MNAMLMFISTIPGPRRNNNPNPNNPCPPPTYTGIFGIPNMGKFPDYRIQKWGDCFLCVCVKGGLTTLGKCMNCFSWGMSTGKLRNSDCFVICNKDQWAKEISSKYGTTYHEDYCFKPTTTEYWLTKNGIVVFHPRGLAYAFSEYR